MKTISSRDNALYKEWKQLATSSQARRKSGRTLLDGVHLAQAYLAYRGMPLWCVVSESAAGLPEVAPLIARCEAGGAACVCLPDALYHALSQVEHGVGLMLIVETPQPSDLAVLDRPAVLLDNLQDPGNLGSILRSAAAAGIDTVVCSPGTVFAWSPKVLRAGMGAHFLLTIHEQADLEALLRNASVPVLATSSHATNDLYDTDLSAPAAWLFGHEGQGVAPHLLALASRKVAIPQPGGIESLNVAAAAAICFFEQVRQQRSR